MKKNEALLHDLMSEFATKIKKLDGGVLCAAYLPSKKGSGTTALIVSEFDKDKRALKAKLLLDLFNMVGGDDCQKTLDLLENMITIIKKSMKEKE